MIGRTIAPHQVVDKLGEGIYAEPQRLPLPPPMFFTDRSLRRCEEFVWGRRWTQINADKTFIFDRRSSAFISGSQSFRTF